MRKDAEARREQLIAAAAELFAEQGLGVPLELVAERAGVGRGTLYRNFTDRHAMIVAVLETRLDELSRFVAERRDDPTLFEDFARHQSSGAAFYARIVLGSGDEEFDRIVTSLRHRIDALLADVIERSITMGSIHAGVTVTDLRIVTRMLIAASSISGADRNEAMERALQIVMAGLAPVKTLTD